VIFDRRPAEGKRVGLDLGSTVMTSPSGRDVAVVRI
jgi:hypothetical protein